MHVSVIIITYNEEKRISTLLDCLAAQTHTDFEVIVSDSKSTDNTRRVVQKYKAPYPLLWKGMRKRGHGLGRNHGAKFAKGKYLLFLDADVVLEPQFIEQFVQKMEKRNIAVAPAYVKIQEKNILHALFFYIFDGIMFLSQWFYPHGVGSCICARKSLHKKIGGFDEKIVIGEDAEYLVRARKQGKVRALAPFARVSARRFREEGIIRLAGKYVYLFLYRIFFGEIRKKVVTYSFGKHRK